MSAEALAALFGRVYNSGVSLDLAGGLNFKNGLAARLNEAAGWIDVYQSEVSGVDVVSFGATGDGVTSDSAAIQAAIDAAEAAGGGIVWLPVGSYKLTTALVIDGTDVELRGSPGSKILVPNNSGGITISGARSGLRYVRFEKSGGTATSSHVHAAFTGADNYMIECGSLNAYQAINMNGATRPRIEGCKIDTASNIAVVITGAVDGAIISGNSILSPGSDGIFLGSSTSDALIVGNRIDTAGGAGIELNGGTRHLVTGNMLVDCTDGGVLVSSGCTNSHVAANKVTGSFGSSAQTLTIASGAVTLANANYVDGLYRVTVQSGTVDDLDTITGGYMGQQITLLITSNDVVVKHATGNIRLDGDIDFAMTSTDCRLALVYDSTNWVEVSRSTGEGANAQTGTTYSFLREDANRRRPITFSNASPITATVEPDSTTDMPIGTQIPILQTGVGALTIAAGAGVTVNSLGGSLTLAGQHAGATLLKTAANTWTLIGGLA